MANKDTKYTIEVELKGDSKQVQKAIKDGLNKDFSAKIGADTSKLSRDINTAIKELNSSDKKVKIGIDGSNIVKDINNALKSIESDSLKKVKLGIDTSNLLRDINKAITTINSSDSLKKLKLGVDVNYLQQQLNKAVRGLDTTVKLKTKLETTSRTSETKGTVTTNKTSKEEAQQYQSLFSKRADSIANLDRVYQEFGRNSKEVSAAIREFAAASKDVRKFGRDTGVLSLNKVKSDIERQLGAGLTTDFTKNWLRMEYDKVLKDIDTLNRQLKPEKYEKAEDDARVKAYNQEYKIRQAIAAAEAKADKDAERAYKERERVLNEELKIRLALGKKGLSGGLSVDEVKNIKEANQATTALSSQFARLRGEALKAGNALNQATNPKDVERLRAEFQKAIQALVNYQRATRGLTKGGEAQLVEKLAIGSIKEKTEAYKVLYEWIKKAVQAQRDLDIGVGRRNPPKSKDTDLMSWFKNMDIGRAVAGMAYAARGELNTVQAFGNLLSSMSQISGVVSTMAKVVGGLTLAGLAVAGVINAVTSAFTQLTSVLGRVANVIYDILRPGIELYKTRQTAELAIAAAISSRATENGKEIPFERAMNISSDMMKRVVADAAMSAFNPQELIDALRGTLPLALGKGWNLAQAYDVTKGVASVAKVINLAPNQVLQELRDILQGTISARSSQVAGATGMTSAELKEAEAQGRLYEYIQEHLAKFTVALERYSTTLAGALDRLSETWALGMESVFQRIAPVANNLINEFIDNFIGVYKDSEGNILRNPADFYTTDAVTGEKVYKEAGFEWSTYITDFGDALVDLIKYIAPIVDEILAFLQELTGKDDVIGAVSTAIKYLIRITVTLGEIIVVVVQDIIKALNEFETPISIFVSGMLSTAKTLFHLGSIFFWFVDVLYQSVMMIVDSGKALIKAVKGDLAGAKAELEDIVKRGDSVGKNYNDIVNMGETINNGHFIATSYEELLNHSLGGNVKKGSFVSDLVNRALKKADEEQNGDKKEAVDLKQILGTAKEDNKQNLANLRKAMQAAIEDIKQALKDALAQLKDIAERNELAYRQGYKSVEDYFTQKAQIEYQEAQLKLDALQKEYALVSALDTGTDESAKYQKDRDLIKLNGEIVIQQREFTKKQEQLLEVAQHIENHMANQTYKYGIQAKSVGGINSSANYNISNADLESWGVNNDMPMSAIKGILKASKELGVDPRLVMAMAMQESGGYQSAVSSVGARGVMQLMPDTAEGLGVDPYDEWENIYGGVKYILQQLEYFGGDMVKAIAAYNAGPGAVDEYGGIPPYEETQNYVKNILSMYEEMGGLNTIIEETTEVIENTTNELHGRMPEAVTTLGEAVEKAVAEGQNQMVEAQKKYASYLNEPYLYETISSAEVSAKYNKQIDIARARYGQMIPAIANYLELAFPVEKLKTEAKSLEQFVDNRLKMIEDDSLAMNKRLREKTVLFPQAIDTYLSYFSEKINDWAITDLLNNMAQKADELAKLGAVSEARDITKKIIEVRSKFISMIQSWIDEMSNYFNYRKELVNADSGLTSFVKEERVKQLEKGEARVKAVAYAQEAVKLDELQTKYQEQLTKVIEGRNDELDKTMQTDTKLLEMSIAQLETEKQRALRQAEINAKLGEQKTLWQETMDAANQALENGLYNFMTDYINTAESIGEAFRNMAIDILKDLQKFFAKKAITDLMHVITGTPNEQYNAPNHAEMQTSVNTGQMVVWLQNIYRAVMALQTGQSSSVFNNVGSSVMGALVGSGTGGSNSIANQILHHKATGGYISGPGTSTSDSIHAMLSNGEYVIKADAVRKYGLNFLDAVNNGHFTRMRTVIPRFADGGYVGDALQDTARGMTDFAKNLGTSVGVDNTISIALVRDEQEAIREWAKSPSGGQKFLVDFAKGNGRVFSRFNR